MTYVSYYQGNTVRSSLYNNYQDIACLFCIFALFCKENAKVVLSCLLNWRWFLPIQLGICFTDSDREGKQTDIRKSLEVYEDSDDSPQAKKKKARTTFTGRQIFELEKQFEQKKYLSSAERAEMASLLNVTETQVFIYLFFIIIYRKANGTAFSEQATIRLSKQAKCWDKPNVLTTFFISLSHTTDRSKAAQFVWTVARHCNVGWLCWCFTFLRHILGHFGRGQLT